MESKSYKQQTSFGKKVSRYGWCVRSKPMRCKLAFGACVIALYVLAMHHRAASPHIAQTYVRGAHKRKAVALPSLRVYDRALDAKRGKHTYGGAGDGAHLGGFTSIDMHGISPAVWRTVMLENLGIKTLVDVGCGKGISTLFFLRQGVDVTCVEGSHDAVTQSILPPEKVVEHDFSRGPWWPEDTVDAVWCVEFTEHVSRQYLLNYAAVFHSAAYIFVSHSNWGGWHHVEVHSDEWWQTKWESQGFVFSQALTDLVRESARGEMGQEEGAITEGNGYYAQHLIYTMQVFINPAVAKLLKHQHLLAEDGCTQGRKDGVNVRKKCGYTTNGVDREPALTALPEEWRPNEWNEKGKEEWIKAVRRSLEG